MIADLCRDRVVTIGETKLGILRSEIGTHSIRSGAAIAMYLSGVPVFSIMLIGRWSSTAFIKYIRKNVQEFLQGISSKMIEVQTFKHVRNPTETNPMENIVGDSFFVADGINWWRKHHRRKDEGGAEPINNWFRAQPSSRLFIGILRYLTHILCTFLFFVTGRRISAKWTPLAEDTLFLGVFTKVKLTGNGFLNLCNCPYLGENSLFFAPSRIDCIELVIPSLRQK